MPGAGIYMPMRVVPRKLGLSSLLVEGTKAFLLCTELPAERAADHNSRSGHEEITKMKEIRLWE